MRFLQSMIALGLLCLPGPALAADYLYTFSGTVTYANNADQVSLYAPQDSPISFSLRLSDSSPVVQYDYGATGSSAVGGPDFQAGTLFPIDRIITVDPAYGYGSTFTPLQSGYNTNDNYSGSVVKDLTAKSLTLTMFFSSFTPPDQNCQERCSGTRITSFATANVFSDAFASPDYRETGTFDLRSGSTGTLGGSVSTYLSFGDYYELDLSQLTVQRLPSAVPEPAAWLMMIGGIFLAGGLVRRRSGERAAFA